MKEVNSMNIEQKTNMQELKVKDYTKVYGGYYTDEIESKPIQSILPKHPKPPGGKSITI